MTFEAIRKDKFCWHCHVKCYEENMLDETNVTYDCMECYRVYHKKCVNKTMTSESLFGESVIRSVRCDECLKVTTGQKIPGEQMEKYCKMFEHAVLVVKALEVNFFKRFYEKSLTIDFSNSENFFFEGSRGMS